MKLAFFISLLVFSYVNVMAKDFSIIIHKPFDSALFNVTENYDRTISAVGFTKNYKTTKQNYSNTYSNAFDYLSSISDIYGYKMNLIKVGKQSNILLNKNITINKLSIAVAVQKTSTNGYFVGGYTMSGKMIVVKLDVNGNLIYSKNFGTKNFNKMNSLIKLRDGGLLAVGFSITSRNTQDNIFRSGLGGNDIFITRFSKNGNILWSKKYGTIHDDRGISAVEADDGSIIVLSTTKYDKNRNITLMRLNENGDKIWLKNFNATKLVEAEKIIKLRNGNFLISLAVYNNLYKANIRLIKFDLHKNIIYDKTISTKHTIILKDIAEFSNGKLMGVGYIQKSFNRDGVAMIFNSDLKLLKYEEYGDENYDTFNALHILHNSQVVAVGVHTDNNSQEENMWIVKLNRDATMAQISLSSNNFYKELCKLFKYEIKTKKIAIKEDLTIDIIDKNLYFKVGAYKLTKQQKNFLKLFSKKLLPFLKVHKNQIALLEIDGHTSSEWKRNNFKNRYIKNENLSLKRAYETLQFIFIKQTNKMQHYLTTILKGSGVNYKDKIMINSKEDKKRSRRVSFKILLK